MAFRILTAVVLFGSILFLPFWLSVILALGAIIYFRYYLEVAFFFLVSDLLFGIPEKSILSMAFMSFVASIIMVFVAEFIKKKLRLKN